MEDKTIELLVLLFSANGIGYAAFKFVALQYNKWQSKRGKSCDYAKITDCAKLHNGLLENVGKMFTEVLGEVKVLSNDIKVMTTQRTFEDGIKRKHDVIVANAIGFMNENKGVHDFAIRKADRFKEFVLGNYKTMWDSSYEVFCDKIIALAESVREEGK